MRDEYHEGHKSYTATILGQEVPITLVSGTAADQTAIRGRLNAAIDVINQHADEISASDVGTIRNVKEVTVNNNLGNGLMAGTQTYNLTTGYILDKNTTIAWLASSFAHEGTHVTQFERGDIYTHEASRRLEHEANRAMIRVGKTFGLLPSQLKALEKDTHTGYRP